MFKHIAGPTGVVQLGFYFFFIAAAVLFCTIAAHAFVWQRWTIFIRAAELISMALYATLCARWNMLARRERIINEYET